jgi:hypothetical protein
VTARLRELFEEMLLREPPLRTTPESAADDGRRIIRRSRTLWTIAGTAMLVALVAMLPGAWSTNRQDPTADGPTADGPTVDGPSTAPLTGPPGLTLRTQRICPGGALTYGGDNSLLPDPSAAMAALLAAGLRIAPGLAFLARSAGHGSVLSVMVSVDIADSSGYASLVVQIRVEAASPAERIANISTIKSCVDGKRYDFADGSVGLYYPYGPPAQEAKLVHVWYFSVRGLTIDIAMSPPAVGSNMPLSIDQVMMLADAVAQAA